MVSIEEELKKRFGKLSIPDETFTKFAISDLLNRRSKEEVIKDYVARGMKKEEAKIRVAGLIEIISQKGGKKNG